MTDYELINEINDHDQKEIDELISEYEIIASFEKEDEEKSHYFDDNDSDEGYY
jgi:hypothetical protein